jgi:hypothetical protein
VNLSKDMTKRIHVMAIKTWDTIANDILNLLDEEGGGQYLPQEDVIDTVADASYMFYHGQDREAYKTWDNLPHEEKISILKGAFPLKKYGW